MKYFMPMLLCFAPFLIQAQITTVSTHGDRLEQPKIIKLQDSSYLQLEEIPGNGKSRSLAYYSCTGRVRHYSKKGELLLQQKPDESKYRFNSLFMELVNSGNDTWMIYLETSDSRVIGNFKAAKITPGTLEIGESKLIASETEVNEKVGLFSASSNEVVASSPNSKFHLFMVNVGDDDVFLTCLDANMNAVWKKKLKIPDWKMDKLNSYCIDDTGNIYLGFQHDYRASITIFDIKGNFVQAPVNFPEDLFDIQIHAFKKTGNIIVAGFYGANHHAKGIYKATLHPKTFELQTLKQTAFPDSLLERLKKDGLASMKNRKYGIWKFNYKSRLMEQQDGTLAMTTELNADLQIGLAIGSLLVFHLPEDSPVVISHIPRYGIAKWHSVYEYVALPGNGEMFLFYWDDIANASRPLSEEQKVLKGASNAGFFAAVIQNNGTITRRSLSSIYNVADMVRFVGNYDE